MGRLATVLLLLLLAGCSLVYPKLKAPQLSIVSAQVQKGDFWTQHVKLRVHVHNPNNRTFPIKGLTYTLDLDGQPFAQGESDTSFVLPAGGDAEFDTTVRVNLASTLIRLLGRDRDRTVEYHIRGKVSFSAGLWLWRSVHFDQRGEVRPRDLLAR